MAVLGSTSLPTSTSHARSFHPHIVGFCSAEHQHQPQPTILCSHVPSPRYRRGLGFFHGDSFVRATELQPLTGRAPNNNSVALMILGRSCKQISGNELLMPPFSLAPNLATDDLNFPREGDSRALN